MIDLKGKSEENVILKSFSFDFDKRIIKSKIKKYFMGGKQLLFL